MKLFKRHIWQTIGIGCLLVTLAACQPQIVEVRSTRVVEHTESAEDAPVGEVNRVQVETVVETVVVEVETEMIEGAAAADDADYAPRAAATPSPLPTMSPVVANESAAQGALADQGQAVTSVVQEAEVVVPEPYLPPEPEAPTDVYFEDYGVNPFIDTRDDNLSTFAIDVDTGAYTVMRRYVTDGLLPPRDAVRVEEFVNYFDQQYPVPQDDAFAIHLEAAPAPYGENQSYHLLRVGIQGYDVPVDQRPDAMLIFVIDVSGSMDQENRLGLVKESLHMLVDNLRPTDQVGIVTYGANARVILAPTYAVADRQLHDAIDGLRAGGGTNMDAGLQLAYDLAAQFGQPGNINRLIVASDGVANIGATTADEILRHARDGIQLSTFGYGMGNYNDVNMEQLANQGDGGYAYIDDLDEAERIFEDQLLATIMTIANDAKIQVEFNPSIVENYRLLGYENRDVADVDFRNDNVDAGEIGAGHSVTALYEVRFAADTNPNEAALTVRVRYEDMDSGEVTEIAQSMGTRDVHGRFTDASASFQLTATVAEYAELLRHSYWAREGSLEQVAADARRLAQAMPRNESVQEFAGLALMAATLGQ